MATVDIEALQTFVDEGYISKRPHPSVPLVIYNYTPKAQYDHMWTPETLMCRGLITTLDGTIVSRCMTKFFNIEEHQGSVPVEAFKVTEKVDGSLGISYHLNGTPYLATRGSFTSEQAIRGTKILHERYSTFEFLPYYTYLFEIIYAENQIVVHYGDMEDLILLTVIHTDSGREIDIHDPTWVRMWPFPLVTHYDGITDITLLQTREETNKEGFVIHFASGLRLKCKMAEYKRLHRLITQVNARVIWDLLRHNQPFDELLDRVPDEFYQWVRNTRKHLLEQFRTIETASLELHEQVKHLPTRKEQALAIVGSPYAAVVFKMLDQKDYAEMIWKQLRPLAEKPFKEDIEG